MRPRVMGPGSGQGIGAKGRHWRGLLLTASYALLPLPALGQTLQGPVFQGDSLSPTPGCLARCASP